jgi:hypothetical protein
MPNYANLIRSEFNELISNDHVDNIPHEQPYIVVSREVVAMFKKYLTKMFSFDKEVVVTVSKGGYCDVSGFISRRDRHVYFSVSDFRHWKSVLNDMLVRTATSTRDFTGGRNQYTTIDNFQEEVYLMLKQ